MVIPMSKLVPLHEHLCYALYSASIAVNRLYKPILDKLGITFPQYLVLCTLWEDGGRTISVVADRLALEPSTITPLVKRLEKAGLVTRQRNSQDERLVEVFLTARGEELKAQSKNLRAALLRKSRLSVHQLLSLNRDVQSLRDALTGAGDP